MANAITRPDGHVADVATSDKTPAGYWSNVFRRLARDRVAVTVSAILLAIVLIAIFAPFVTSYDPYAGDIFNRLSPIGAPGHFLGTDETGRDMWTRLAYGGRLSLLSAIIPVFVALTVGGVLGVVAGYAGGLTNTLIMRTADVFYAFPSILLAVAVCGLLGSGLANALVALSIIFIPPMIRVAESVTAQVRNLDFVEAARASGTTTLQIIRHHILINVFGTILVYTTSLVSISIVLSAGLSFLGLGATPPAPEWGVMLNALRQAIPVQPAVAGLPGFMILITSMCFNVISDRFRNAMDVKLNE
jgi:peptide/nickel transport system permease protein